ncbi:MAG: hypothetical protein CM1200mP2_43330 [Planctomycetaceae bacterium]|nr:MAG: hypothetical protein CM1200mP2_43330 [Planctomycetaceae bacterium]
MHRHSLTLLLTIAGLIPCRCLPSSRLGSVSWPQRHGSLGGQQEPASQLLHHGECLWKKTLGTGIACPIISGGRCIETAVTGKKGQEQFVVSAFDALTGKDPWKTSFPAGKLPEITWPNQHAS